jgi:hypothetical protein
MTRFDIIGGAVEPLETIIIEVDLRLVDSPSPIAFTAGQFDRKLGRAMPTDYELSAEYVRGYNSAS